MKSIAELLSTPVVIQITVLRLEKDKTKQNEKTVRKKDKKKGGK